MSLPTIRFEKGVEEVLGVLRGFEERTKRWERTAPRLHRFMLRRAEDLFRTQGASEGVKWPGYSGEPKYTAYKKAHGVPLARLRWEGGDKERLYPSMTRAQHPEHVFRRTPKGISFGTRVPYARRLHEGGGKNQFDARIPARPIAVAGVKTRGKLAEMILMYITTGSDSTGPWTE